jgi:hypothetical protein
MRPSASQPSRFGFDPGKVLRGLRARARHVDYSPNEVRLRLRLDPADDNPRTQAVHTAAADIGAWTQLLPPDADREARLSLAAARLPSVVFWYRRGLSAEEIGRRLTPFGDSTYGERAINAACALIARLLNHH